MIITSHIFEAYLKCPSKCWFRFQGEEDAGNVYPRWTRNRNQVYRREALNRILADLDEDDFVFASAQPLNIKMAKWRFALDFVVHSKNLETSVQAIERIPSKGRGRSTLFIPIRFTFFNKLTRDDKLLLAFDALVLSEMSGLEVSLGRIIHGDNYSTLKVNTAALRRDVRKLIGKLDAMLSSHSPPDIVLNRHCGECELQALCRQKVIEKDDLSLLAGMTEKERRKFNSKGIFTVTQLSYTFRPRRRPRRLATKREKYHHSLKALAIREKKIHIVDRPELKIEGTPVFLDVEGLPDSDSYYLIGIRTKTVEGIAQHSLWANKADDEATIWIDLLCILSQIKNPVLIHYGSFETTFIKRMCDRYGGPTADSAAANAIKTPVNLLSVIYSQIYFPTFSNGLKEIAGYLGFTWSEPSASGLQTISWRAEWEATGSPTLKTAILMYNAEDCQALEIVANKVMELYHSSPDADGASEKSVVHTEKLKRDNPYGFMHNEFFCIELDRINKAAYWDYQRERVYVKSNARLRGALKRSSKNKKSQPPNKVIEVSRPQSCPKCASTVFYAHGKTIRTVYDLKFTTHGIKRWIVCYRGHRYICRRCGVTFFPKIGRWAGRSKFGTGIVAYSLYQNIELRLPQINVDRSTNRLFGFHLPIETTNHFKAQAAKIYGETYDALLRRICKGRLIHADETKISVRGKDGFVWVFANMEEVAYVYSETRHGDIVERLLKDFTGVLVSDFYAAYDRIPCPQQKCLIHLIRDLNDTVLKHPYDEELKGLVKSFADLVKPMVETVDRYGLKSRFLRKHLVAVDRFYKRISQTELKSEPVAALKGRFEKNRDKLFTFLLYDGVPWNNNNAEHAIKAFAMLRNVIAGVTSEKGIREYMVLLSISETCKYREVDFLDFLRSGEKDIHAFTESKKRRAKIRASS